MRHKGYELLDISPTPEALAAFLRRPKEAPLYCPVCEEENIFLVKLIHQPMGVCVTCLFKYAENLA